jgi:hypothetical protein
MSAVKTQAKPNTVKANYEVEVTLEGKGEYKKTVLHLPRELRLGKTVHYFTNVPNATVTIKFAKSSPYLHPDGRHFLTVKSTDPPLKLSVDGDFLARCYIDQQVHNVNAKAGVTETKQYGWSKDDPDAGGNHVVK